MVSASISTPQLLVRALISMRFGGHQCNLQQETLFALLVAQSKVAVFVGFSACALTPFLTRGDAWYQGLKGQIFRVRGGVVWAPGNLSPSHILTWR